MFKLMFPGKKQKLGLSMIPGGLILIVLGALWMGVLFPSMSKIPCDLSSTTYQEGTVTMLNTQTYQPVTYNVTGTRVVEATGCEGNTVFLTEDVSFIDNDTGDPIQMLVSYSEMAVDRSTKMYVPGAVDEYREGYWMTPAGVTEDDVLDVWITGMPTTIQSRFDGWEDLEGVHLMCRYATTPEGGITVPATDTTPEMTIYAEYWSKVEPTSGALVDSASQRTRSMMMPNPADTSSYIEVTVYEDDLEFTDGQVEELIEDAKEYKSQITLYGTTMPWVIIIIGILEMVLGVWMSGIPKIVKYVISMKKQKAG
jgi:hypothetical protein